MKEKLKNRALELDLIRGFAVVLMMFDHLMYDFWGLLPSFIKDYPLEMRLLGLDYWYWDVRRVVRIGVIFLFFALTGICSSFSRSNLGRGTKLFAVAMVLTAATWGAGLVTGNPNMTIAFGVLHAIAVSLILVGILEKLRTNKWIYLAAGVLLVGLGIWIAQYNVGLVSYKNAENVFALVGKTVLGLAECGSDSFDLPTTAGQIFIGVFLGKQFYGERKSLVFKSYHDNPLAFVGRHSLIVYFAHQVLFPVIAVLVFLCLGYELAL